MNCWKDKTIMINDQWGAGGRNLLLAPLGCNAEISLRARYLRKADGTRQPAQFEAECSSGYLGEGWQGAVFTPVGHQAVTGIFGLPPWDGTPATQTKYRDMINGTGNNLNDSTTRRLEATVPYMSSAGTIGYDTVRLFYVFDAVEGSEIADLVVVKIAALLAPPGTVSALQEGTGQGPPH